MRYNKSEADSCLQLLDAYYRCDGEFPPPDFVVGEAAKELSNLILELMKEPGCK